MIVRILMLVALVKLLIVTDKPLVCACIYSGVRLFFCFVFGTPILVTLIGGVIGFGLALLYFWLLSRFRDTGWFWVVLCVGVLIGVV